MQCIMYKVLSGIMVSCVTNDLAYFDTCVCIAQNKVNSNALDFVTRRPIGYWKKNVTVISAIYCQK